MNNLALTFPAMPADADKRVTRPTKQFRDSTYKVISAIALFVVVYILLLISATAIAIAMGWIGVVMILAMHNFLVLVLGAGLILSGLMLIFFLIKFIFTRTPERVTGHEITEDEQPGLFAFIKKVTNEVGTTYPKHVYLTNDVNASASFNPSFWSLFLPIRKDLTIGIGLVNGINKSELKAVLAHEFGHFSQRSMRFGSYVYHLNRALYNLLYENEGYNKALNAWGRWHWMLRFGAIINVYIIRCIQEILRKVYLFINKAYMELSREMEFHADTIAAYASGANNVVSSLRRLEITEQCYNQAFSIINANLAENKRPANIYDLHRLLLKQYAADHRLDTDIEGLPVIDKKVTVLNNSQITLDHQWSSHPLTEDREENVNRLNLNSAVIHEPAWSLFKNADKLQKQFTEELYDVVDKKEKLAIIAISEIEEDLEKERATSSYDKRYKGFYNGRSLSTFNIEETITTADDGPKSFTELFTNENCNLSELINALNTDIIKLDTLIEDKNDNIRSFDFRGVKHYPVDAADIKQQLEAELKEKETCLQKLDESIFMMFHKAATANNLKNELIGHYEKVFRYQSDAVIDFGNHNMMMNAMRPVYTRMSYNDIYATVNRIYEIERDIKPRIAEKIAEAATKPFISEQQQEILDKYLNNNWVYFLEPKYDNNALSVLNSALSTYLEVLARRNFQFKKDLFDFQLTLNYPNKI